MSSFVRHIRLRALLLLTALFVLPDCSAGSPPPLPTSTPDPREPSAFSGFIYGGNVQRTGVYNGGGAGPKFGKRLWTYEANDLIESEITIGGGLAFISVYDSGLQAIDTKTGELKYTLSDFPSLPTVADGVLYYTDRDGLHAMDLATRKDNWVFRTIWGRQYSPVVDDGVVYFGGGTDPSGSGRESGYFFAVDARTGQEKWHLQVGNAYAAAAGDGMLFFVVRKTIMYADDGQTSGILHAVDMQTGKEVWHVGPPSSKEQPGDFVDPIYYDGRVYSATSSDAYLGPGHVYAFDAKTGKEIWKQTTPDGLSQPKTPLAYDGMLYVPAGAPDLDPRRGSGDPLYAFDAKTGQAEWTFRPGGYMREPSISNGTLYVCSGGLTENSGALYSLDPRSGKQLDKMELEDSPRERPAIADGVIYVEGISSELGEEVLIAVSTLPGSP